MVEISERAKLKACELANALHGYPRFTVAHVDADWPSLQAFAAFIQQVNDACLDVTLGRDSTAVAYGAELVRKKLAPFILPEPVDPLLIEAREIAAAAYAKGYENSRVPVQVLEGNCDHDWDVQACLTALKRGMELAREKPDA